MYMYMWCVHYRNLGIFRQRHPCIYMYMWLFLFAGLANRQCSPIGLGLSVQCRGYNVTYDDLFMNLHMYSTCIMTITIAGVYHRIYS